MRTPGTVTQHYNEVNTKWYRNAVALLCAFKSPPSLASGAFESPPWLRELSSRRLGSRLSSFSQRPCQPAGLCLSLSEQQSVDCDTMDSGRDGCVVDSVFPGCTTGIVIKCFDRVSHTAPIYEMLLCDPSARGLRIFFFSGLFKRSLVSREQRTLRHRPWVAFFPCVFLGTEFPFGNLVLFLSCTAVCFVVLALRSGMVSLSFVGGRVVCANRRGKAPGPPCSWAFVSGGG